MGSGSGSVIRRLVLCGVMALFLTGCIINPVAITREEHAVLVSEDLERLGRGQEPLTGKVDLYQAMARTIKFNLDHRLKMMEAALSQRQLSVATLEMLPQLAASAGYEGRDSYSGSSSRSLTTGDESLETSTSQDKRRNVYDLGLSWNVLDFGLSYVRAKQQADRTLIALERRRKVIHNIIQDTRSAYWRAVSAQRLLRWTNPLMNRVRKALADARRIEAKRLKPPMEILQYRRTLLEVLRQLKTLNRELNTAITHLATLMNVMPGEKLELAIPDDYRRLPALPTVTARDLERMALVNRPELREEAYQKKISAAETHKALLELLPGINLDGGYNFDSNSFLSEKHWWDYSARVSWNLFNVFNLPAKMRMADARERVVEMRRLALSMAVISQVHISWARLKQARSELITNREVRQVESQIFQKVQAEYQTQRRGELDLIRARLDLVLAELRRDLAFSEYQNAYGRLFVSAGLDPLPETVAAHDLETLADALRGTIEGWSNPLPADMPDMGDDTARIDTAPILDESPSSGRAGKMVETPVPDLASQPVHAQKMGSPPVVGEQPSPPAVKPEPEVEEPKEERLVDSSRSGGDRYTIQTGSYRFVNEAKAEMARLREKGYEPILVEQRKNQRSRPWFAVHIPGFDGYSAALTVHDKLKRKTHIDGLIVADNRR